MIVDALVIIDVQQGMFAFPELQPFEGEALVARLSALLARARAAKMPVIIVQHNGGVGSPLAADSPGFAFRPELSAAPGEMVVVKRNCSAFQDTDFEARLRAAGISHLIVCGMQSEYCVDTTVRAAFERGFAVTLVADGHSTFDTPDLGAAAIIAHHNRTLTSFAKIEPIAALAFAAG